MSRYRPPNGIPMPGFGLLSLIAAALIIGWVMKSEQFEPEQDSSSELTHSESTSRIQAVSALVKRGRDGVSEGFVEEYSC